MKQRAIEFLWILCKSGVTPSNISYIPKNFYPLKSLPLLSRSPATSSLSQVCQKSWSEAALPFRFPHQLSVLITAANLLPWCTAKMAEVWGVDSGAGGGGALPYASCHKPAEVRRASRRRHARAKWKNCRLYFFLFLHPPLHLPCRDRNRNTEGKTQLSIIFWLNCRDFKSLPGSWPRIPSWWTHPGGDCGLAIDVQL